MTSHTLSAPAAVLASSLAMALAVSVLGGTQSPASGSTAREASGSVTVTDATSGSSFRIAGTQHGRTPSGRRGFVGTIHVDVEVPPANGASHDPGIGLFLDVDGDARPEFLMVTLVPSGEATLYRNGGWAVDPKGADLSYQSCVSSRYDEGDYVVRYDPDCLGAGATMRSAVVIYAGEDHWIGAPRTWSAPVRTPSGPQQYCTRRFGPISNAERDVELSHDVVRGISCSVGLRVVRRAQGSFRRSDARTMKVGRFRCVDKNGIGTVVVCRHQHDKQRWVTHWHLA